MQAWVALHEVSLFTSLDKVIPARELTLEPQLSNLHVDPHLIGLAWREDGKMFATVCAPQPGRPHQLCRTSHICVSSYQEPTSAQYCTILALYR